MTEPGDKDINDFVNLSKRLAVSFYKALVIQLYLYTFIISLYIFILTKPQGVNYNVNHSPEKNYMPGLLLTQLSQPFVNFLSWQRIMTVN